jgi:branched-subunit amino acid aminotransferase/4-amino-4-deoxychorismate lyase
MSEERIYRWHERVLVPLDYCDMAETTILVADSWLVSEGNVRALGLHRDRFLDSIDAAARTATDADLFWDESIALLPRTGAWFPRVELQDRSGSLMLVLRIRSAPETTRSIVVQSWEGDPRTQPLVKGPDLATMIRIRTAIQPAGAGEAVILTPEGYLVDGAYSALAWWRGDILCTPPLEFDRVDSVTARSVLAVAAALGIETYREAVTPAEVEGTELWSLNALHGARIVTRWLEGPELAELPGRLSGWRTRLDTLRKPI